MIDEFKAFIEANRQRGSTTETAWACIRADGYLVVNDMSAKKRILRQFTALKEGSVFTTFELRDGKGKGLPSKPVFIDVSCFGGNVPSDPVMNMSLGEVIRRVKGTMTEEAPLDDVPGEEGEAQP